MQAVQEALSQLGPKIFNKNVGISIGSIILVAGIAKLYFKRQRELKRKSYPKDVVILHQFPKSKIIPSLSPYVLKLETWLKMSNIKYQNEHGYTFGPKGKLPFITFNGEDVADSDFCIEFLSKKLDKDLNASFSAKDQGAARAFSKMLEESTVWVLALQRFLFGPDSKMLGMPWFVILYFGRVVKKRSQAQGYGLHSQQEVYSIGRKDLKSLNDFLEGKKFLLGDKPCNEDAAVFGITAQLLYTEKGPTNQFIKSQCPNIIAYIENIRATYWPEWK